MPRKAATTSPPLDRAAAWAKVQAMIDAAIAAGSHSPIERWGGRVCPRCGEWTRPKWIVLVDPVTDKPIAGTEHCTHACACDHFRPALKE